AGAFEGDGGSYEPYPGAFSLNFSGTHEMCLGFKNYMGWETKVSKINQKKYDAYFMSSKFYSKFEDFLPHFKKLYNSYSINNNLYLPRKIYKMINFLNWSWKYT
ncbi:MAG: hypothetical protein Q8M92_03855, partial [Candidatus Subteraquimicrobiales bacterium]|nr:hypothetical protein [Candidatus Subteraquimicrobiales bacterium]